jgi:hypothetical protein
MTDDEIIVTCLKPEIHKLNEKLAKEHRSQATEAEFLGAFDTAMRNMIKKARADERAVMERELKAESDKAMIELTKNGFDIKMPESWGAAHEKRIRINERAITEHETAQRIFGELDKVKGYAVPVAKLEKFVTEFYEATDKETAEKVLKRYCTLEITVADLEAFKAKFLKDDKKV